jgi:hypothetical protein
LKQNKHREQYEAYNRKRSLRILIAFIFGVSCLIAFELLKNSASVAAFMEKANRSREDRALFFNIVAALINYVLPSAGIATIIFTTYMALFKKDQ